MAVRHTDSSVDSGSKRDQDSDPAHPPVRADRRRPSPRPRTSAPPENQYVGDLSHMPYVSDAFARVPGIGKGNRWYDMPYRILHALIWGRPKRLTPRWVRIGPLLRLLNRLDLYFQLDVARAWSRQDPMRNVFVPHDEHVRMPGLWIVELFPPSALPGLVRSMKRRHWDRTEFGLSLDQPKTTILSEARTGHGYTWWKLAEVSDRRRGYTQPDSFNERLPRSIRSVSMTAVQVGSSLTAIVAYFRLSDDAARALDREWHAEHEPMLVRGAGRPNIDDRMFASFRKGQAARSQLHGVARAWLRKRCPGFFAANGEATPLVDLLLFEKFEPDAVDRIERPFNDALRSLGITELSVYRRSSPNLPGLLLDEVESDLCPGITSGRTWGLVGNTTRVANATTHLAAYGGSDSATGIANHTDHSIHDFLVLLSLSDLLQVFERRYADLRDTASTRHRRFSVKALKQLRSAFLQLSLDLVNVSRDVRTFHGRRGLIVDGHPRFTLRHAPFVERHDEGMDSMTLDMDKLLHRSQRQRLKRLTAVDTEYRDILATAASLGASVDAHRVGSAIKWLAAATLAVASITLLATRVAGDSPAHAAFDWVRSWFG